MADPSFQDLVNAMVASLQAANSKLTDFTATSVVLQIMQAAAAQIDQVYYAKDQSDAQANITTATDTGLDAKGSDYGIPRKQATPAQMYFTFVKNVVSTLQIPIAAGTIITTIPAPGSAPITYATNADASLPIGTGTVSVLATAQTPGSAGNISPSTPLLIGSALSGIDGVTLPNLTNAIMGTDTETDDQYRARLLIGLASKAQGTVAWYQAEATLNTLVASAKVIPINRGPGTVDIYIIGPGNTIPITATVNQVQALIDANRIITDDAKVFVPTALVVNWTINVKVTAATDLTVSQNQIKAAIQNYITALGIGAGVLGFVYGSQINAVALSNPGTLTTLALATPLADIAVGGTQIPQYGTITVNTSH